MVGVGAVSPFEVFILCFASFELRFVFGSGLFALYSDLLRAVVSLRFKVLKVYKYALLKESVWYAVKYARAGSHVEESIMLSQRGL